MAINFGELTSRKVAGVPVIWVVAIVAAVGLWGALRLKPAAVEDEPTDAAATDAGVDGDGLDTDQPVFSATPVIYQPSGGSVASTPMEDSNELWGRRATEWLVANGFTLSVASNAITKYLDGNTLSFEEGKARDKAVAQFGIPPEGLLPTSTSGAPVTPASTQGVPPLTHTVKNSRDNTSAELARLYYGSANADFVNRIDASNVTKPKPYPVGTKVRIPAYHEPKYYRATSATRTLAAIARKNGKDSRVISELNPRMSFPVRPGTKVRVR